MGRVPRAFFVEERVTDAPLPSNGKSGHVQPAQFLIPLEKIVKSAAADGSSVQADAICEDIRRSVRPVRGRDSLPAPP
jgi:hypothetical protein